VEKTGVAKEPKDIGFYMGLLLTVFLATNGMVSPFWGWLSDCTRRRKPFVLTGAFGTMVAFLLLGFSSNYNIVLK